MNRTKKLLLEIKNAISDGRLAVENVPVNDIMACVCTEITLNRCTFTESRFADILDDFENVCRDVSGGGLNRDSIMQLINTMVLCLDMLSESVFMLANGEYWRFKHQQELDDPDIREIISFIDQERKLRLINYEFVRKYEEMAVAVYFDENCGMRYVSYKEKRMYFPKSWDNEKVVNYFRNVVMEQDIRSPHCYQNDACCVRPGDVVVDAGTAEGIFALDIIDMAGKVYMLEPDLEWVEALEKTFESYKDKICIIPRFLGQKDDEQNVSLDGLFGHEKIDYIKMDIEGFEKEALLGGKALFESCDNIRCAICVYHCKEDEKWVKDMFGDYGFRTEPSKGFMCPDWTLDAYLEAELRRGIIFVFKEK